MFCRSLKPGIFLVCVLLAFCLPVSAYSPEAAGQYSAGLNLTQAGNYTEAAAAFQKAVALEPSYFEAWNGIADILNRDGQFSPALAASNRSLAINPEYAEGWINRGQILYNIGYVYENQSDMKTANALYNDQLTAFRTAEKIDPKNAEAWFNEGYALAGLKRYDEAISTFNHVAALDPAYPKLQANIRIAEKLRDASTPVYVKYWLPIAGLIAVAGVVMAWVVLRKRT